MSERGRPDQGRSRRTRPAPLARPSFGPITLRARLALTTALACVLAVVLVAAALYAINLRFFETAQVNRLESAMAVIEPRVGRSLHDYGNVNLDEARGDEVTPDILIRLTYNGSVVAASPHFPAGIRADLAPGNYRMGQGYVVSRTLGRLDGFCLTLVSGRGVVAEARRAFVQALTVLLPFVLLLSALVGWLVAGRLLRPVAALERTAHAIGESGDLTRPVPGAGGRDELSRLAATLQGVFGQLARTRAREQEFVRAAAHDLRGPLAALQTRVSLALARPRDEERYRQDLAEVGTDLGRLSRLAEHLLLLARNPDTLSLARVNLLDVASTAVDTARSANPEHWVELTGAPVFVQGDRVLLGQAVTNLLQNAARHAPEAPVTVHVGEQDGLACLRVHDEGPGVSDVSRLGEAFYRPDEARAGLGSGLGLAIVLHVAELHGGQLRLESGAGEGFTALLELPLIREL